MCTIGAIYNKGLILFKNCDLDNEVKFFKPEIRKGLYKYIAFTRDGRPGLWAGINEFGVGIVAADTHTKKKYKARPHTINNIFKGYEKSIANFKNVNESEVFLKDYFKNKIKTVPDLFIIADRNGAKVVEFTPDNKWKTETIRKHFIIRSNHFIISDGALSKKEDPDSYIRYETANELLKKDSSLEGIMKLCKNHNKGPSTNSICRHSKKGYNTKASAIMQAGKQTTAYYVINNYPCKTNYKKVVL